MRSSRDDSGVGLMVIRRGCGRRCSTPRCDFGPWWANLSYDYPKDFRTYFIIVLISLSRLWLLRQQARRGYWPSRTMVCR